MAVSVVCVRVWSEWGRRLKGKRKKKQKVDGEVG